MTPDRRSRPGTLALVILALVAPNVYGFGGLGKIPAWKAASQGDNCEIAYVRECSEPLANSLFRSKCRLVAQEKCGSSARRTPQELHSVPDMSSPVPHISDPSVQLSRHLPTVECRDSALAGCTSGLPEEREHCSQISFEKCMLQGDDQSDQSPLSSTAEWRMGDGYECRESTALDCQSAGQADKDHCSYEAYEKCMMNGAKGKQPAATDDVRGENCKQEADKTCDPLVNSMEKDHCSMIYYEACMMKDGSEAQKVDEQSKKDEVIPDVRSSGETSADKDSLTWVTMDGEKYAINNQPKPSEEGKSKQGNEESSSVAHDQKMMPNDYKNFQEEEEPGCLKKICETVAEKRCFQADHHHYQTGCQEVPMEDCTAYVQTYTEHVCSNETDVTQYVQQNYLSDDCHEEDIELCNTSFEIKLVQSRKTSCVTLPSIVECTPNSGCASIPDKRLCKEVHQTEVVPTRKVACRKEKVHVCSMYESAQNKVESYKVQKMLCGQAKSAVLLPDVCTTDFHPHCPSSYSAPAEVCRDVMKKKCRCAEST